MRRAAIRFFFPAAALALLWVAPLAALGPLPVQSSPPVDELGRLPILSGGRVMPMDSWARLVVAQISEARTAAGLSPMAWVAKLLFDPGSTADDLVFFVGHPDSLAALGLGTAGRGRYSLRQLQPGLARLSELAAQIDRRGGAADAVEADLLRLKSSIDLDAQIAASLESVQAGPASDDSATLLREWTRGTDSPLKVIPSTANASVEWLSPDSAMLAGDEAAGRAGLFSSIARAWAARDWAAARSAIAGFEAASRPFAGTSTAAAGLEVLYNRSRPFLASSLLALLACVLWPLGLRLPLLRRLSLAVLAGAFLVYTAGLVARIAVTGRPPVTNLYSSFLFVAWLMLGFGMLLSARRQERMWPILGPVGAILLTALSSRFALEGDQLGVLQAVLDTNFWLSTHVIAISTGYMGALAAGLVGHVWFLRRIARPSDERGLARTEAALRGTLMAALVFTFLGTVLGGIWADQSWGRFWGWDPKENGALLIIIWMAILQHARLARMIEARGLAVGSVLLVVVVLFSWLGVNLMGVGLHSYGWTQGVGAILAGATGFEVLFVILGLLAARARDVPLPGVRSLRVAAIARETPDAVTVTLAARPGNRIAAAPGQFVTVFARIDGITYRRAYSLSRLSRSGLRADITVRRVEGGRVSGWIADSLRPGARLTVAGPGGSFGLNGAGHDADSGAAAVTGAVFVAGGSGIAPLAPMAEEYLATRPGPLLLLYGSRDERHIIFRDRLAALAAADPRLTVRHVLSDPAADWTGDRGWVDGAFVLRAAPPRDGREYYLCGPAEMVDEVSAALAGAGVAASRIHQERFLPGPSAAARRAGRGATVRFRRTGREVRVLPGQSVLEAGLRAGLRLPYGCAAGQCRECAARLLAGRVEMDSGGPLSDAEKENEVILTCVAYPVEDSEVDL